MIPTDEQPHNGAKLANGHSWSKLCLLDLGTHNSQVIGKKQTPCQSRYLHICGDGCKPIWSSGLFRVADAKPHPQADEIINDIDTNQITNTHVRHFLNLKNEGYNVMDTMDEDVSGCFPPWCGQVFVGSSVCEPKAVLYAKVEGQIYHSRVWKCDSQLGILD